ICCAGPEHALQCADSETPPPGFAVPRHSTSARSNFFTPFRRNISAQMRRENVSSGTCEKIGKATASARLLESPLWWLRSDAVRIGLSGQYGDRRNISAQMRRENVSSVPALQRGLTPKRRHQDLPFRATRPAADPIFSHLPVPALERGLTPKRPPGFAVPRHSTSSRSNFFTPSCPRIGRQAQSGRLNQRIRPDAVAPAIFHIFQTHISAY